MLSTMPDAEVYSAFAAGDELALREAYNRWSPLVHTLALRSIGNPADAAEVTQAVFVSAWKGRATYDPGRAPLPAWLIGIARRRIVDQHRATARHPVPVAEVPEMTQAAAVDGLAQRLLVADALADLPDDRRRVLELSIYGEQTHAEIAATTGLPLGTVKSHLRRGLEHLRTRLEAS